MAVRQSRKVPRSFYTDLISDVRSYGAVLNTVGRRRNDLDVSFGAFKARASPPGLDHWEAVTVSTKSVESQMDKIVLESVITCPNCGHAKREAMPTDACQWYYECESCKTLLRPSPGDCCVFCSFGSVKCPPIQEQKRCCG